MVCNIVIQFFVLQQIMQKEVTFDPSLFFANSAFLIKWSLVTPLVLKCELVVLSPCVGEGDLLCGIATVVYRML